MILHFYADDSRLKLHEATSLEDTFLFGGVLLSLDAANQISAIVGDVKRMYRAEGLPIKWNFKDLKETYTRCGEHLVFEKMNRESWIWRQKIIELAQNVEYTIVICGIVSYSSEKDKIIQHRQNVSKYTFANVLQRVGLEVKSTGGDHVQVYLDWPSENKPHPFTDEYHTAFYQGQTTNGYKYHCGKLKSLNFSDSVAFKKSESSALLQFTDMVVGATKDFLDTVAKDRTPSLGYECMKLLLPKFRGYPDDVLTHGLKLKALGNANLMKLFAMLNALSLRSAA